MGTPKSQQSPALQSAMQGLAEVYKTAVGASVEEQRAAQQLVVNQMRMVQMQMVQIQQQSAVQMAIAQNDVHPPLPGRQVVKESELVKERKRKVRVV